MLKSVYLTFYRIILIPVAYLFTCLSAVSAQTLDIDSFINTILQQNPGVQRILLEEQAAAGRLESSQGIDDTTLSSSLGLNHSEPDRISGFEALESDNQSLSLSVRRQFSNSGTRLSLSYDNNYTDRNPPVTSLGSTYYQPSVTLQLTQPLFKNAGGIQDRLNIELNRLGLQLARLNSREELESYIGQLAALYLDWYLAGREAMITKEVYQQAIEQEKLVRLKVKRQVAESYELLRIQELKEDYYARWQQNLGKYMGLTEQVKQQLNNDVVGAEEFSPVNPENARIFDKKHATVRNHGYLANHSRLKGILDALQAQQEFLANAKQNATEADLSLNLSYSRHGVDSDFSDAHSDNFEKDDYSVSLQYNYPLGNRRATGEYRQQLALKRQTEADNNQRLIDAQARLRDAMQQADKTSVALQAAERKIQLARRKLKQEQRLYKIGRLDLFELLQDHSAQLEARLNKEQLFVQYLKIRLTVGELLDQTLDAYSDTTNELRK